MPFYHVLITFHSNWCVIWVFCEKLALETPISPPIVLMDCLAQLCDLQAAWFHATKHQHVQLPCSILTVLQQKLKDSLQKQFHPVRAANALAIHPLTSESDPAPVIFDRIAPMTTSSLSPDVLEESNIPVLELPHLPSTNQSPGSNSISSL